MELISMISNRRVEKLLLLCVGFMLIGCGGGGSTGNSGAGATNDIGTVGDGVPTKPMATITNENAEDVLSLTFGGIDIVDVPRSLALDGHNYVSESGTKNCSGGGSFTYDGNAETGGTIIFSQCIENSETLNGTQIVLFDGDTIHSELTNFSIKSLSSDTFIASSTLDFNENTEALSMNLTGSSSLDGVTLDFENYNLSGPGNTFSVSGLIQSNFVLGWLEIETVVPIKNDDGVDCPIGGEIITKGNNSELRTVFNSDTSIQVFLNDAVFATYANCNELPKLFN